VEQLLSAKALAEILGLAVQTLYNRHSTGGDLPPSIKLGQQIRFRPSDVEAWLEGKFTAPKPPSLPLAPPVGRRRGRPTKAEQIAARRLN
jgi:predicted DNA-binding transcriptional regulator AlpA